MKESVVYTCEYCDCTSSNKDFIDRHELECRYAPGRCTSVDIKEAYVDLNLLTGTVSDKITQYTVCAERDNTENRYYSAVYPKVKICNESELNVPIVHKAVKLRIVIRSVDMSWQDMENALYTKAQEVADDVCNTLKSKLKKGCVNGL